MTRHIWTIGYEGHSPESLTLRLREAKVQRVVDIRELPLSRKAGFSKKALTLGLAAAGIEYSHMRALGTPREIRHAYKGGGGYAEFRKGYLAHLKGERAAIEELERVAEAERCALLCVEKDPAECHRTILGAVLAMRGWGVVAL